MSRPIKEFTEDPQLRDWRLWPEFPLSCVLESYLPIFLQRQDAIKHYLDKGHVSEAAASCHISRQHFHTLVKRCICLESTGRVVGWRAINLGYHSPYNFKFDKVSKGPGAFTGLLLRYPAVEEAITQHALGKVIKRIGTKEVNASVLDIHRTFKNACRACKITHQEYPFNTKRKGKEALRRWLILLVKAHPIASIKNQYGADAERRFQECTSPFIAESTVRPYHWVEIDGHSIQGLFTLTMVLPNGREIIKVVNRIWLILAIDIGSRAVLGYHISYAERSYTAMDVLYCLSNALQPWQPREFTFPSLKLFPGAGMPSGSIPECAWRLFDVLSFDNARAHIANHTISTLHRVVGCDIHLGPAGKKEMRGTVERIFKTIAGRVTSRLLNTTGKNSSDSDRRNPEKEALKLKINAEHLEDLFEICITKYNSEGNQELGGDFSPLDYLEHELREGRELPRYLSEEDQQLMPTLEFQTTATVRADLKNGRAPYVFVSHARYGSPILSERIDLINQDIVVIYNLADMRYLKIFETDGTFVDRAMVIDRRWRGYAHSLTTRKLVAQVKDDLDLNENYDYVLCLQAELQKQARKDKRYATKLMTLEREAGLRARPQAPLKFVPVSQPGDKEIGKGSAFTPYTVDIFPPKK